MRNKRPHARFDQRSLYNEAPLKMVQGRNTIVYPPKYDFGLNKMSLQLFLFYERWERRQTAGKWFSEDTNQSILATEFDLDEGSARTWRDAYNRGEFVIDIWFSPLHVRTANWQESPTYIDGTLSHNIVIDVETIHYETPK